MNPVSEPTSTPLPEASEPKNLSDMDKDKNGKLELTLEKKEGESVLNFCADCAPNVTEAVSYFQGVFKALGENQEECEQMSKRVKTLEGNVQYLLGQLDNFVSFEEVQKFQAAVVAKHEQLDADIALVKKLVTTKSTSSPIDQWKNLISEIDSANAKKRRK